jgi:DNA-binding response OmpR family regulator
VSFTLRFAGHTVIAFPNGAELVDAAKMEQPDLIMMDVRMPRMSGYEACKALKADPLTAPVPVVLLSAKGQEEEIRTGLASGASEYFLKPFAPMELSARVGELLEKFAKK